MKSRLILIKLGGSVITFKDKPLSANYSAINNISKILGRLEIPIIIVHGGGSYGHYWSVKFDMHTKLQTYDPHGISIVHSSMVTLNNIIVGALEQHRLNPYGISPSSLLLNNNSRPKQIPSTGNPSLTAVFSINASFCIELIALSKLPTPGNTSPSYFSKLSKVRIISTLCAPFLSSDWCKLNKLPAPKSKIAILVIYIMSLVVGSPFLLGSMAAAFLKAMAKLLMADSNL